MALTVCPMCLGFGECGTVEKAPPECLEDRFCELRLARLWPFESDWLHRSAPIRSKRGYLKLATHLAFRCRPRSSQSSAPKGATPRLLARFAGSVSCPFGTMSYPATRAPESRRFQRVKASETFCVLVAYTEPQKVLGASKEPKAMRFAAAVVCFLSSV